MAAPGIPVPFVAGVIDCKGTSVSANVINVSADPEHVKVGMPLRLATYVMGADSKAPRPSASASSRPDPRKKGHRR